MHTMIKRILLPVFLILALSPFLKGQGGYDILLNIKHSRDTTVILGRYFADMRLLVDTAKMEAPGIFRFKGDDTLESGMFMIVPQNNVYFEIVIGKDKQFTLSTDTLDLVGNMKVSGDIDNQVFFDYLHFIRKKQDRKQELLRLRSGDGLSPEADSLLKAEQDALDKEVEAYHAMMREKHPDAVISAIVKSSHDVELPDPWPMNSKGEPDSAWVRQYYQDHYWDDFDFTDARLLRSPVYHNKLDAYYSQVLLQAPDTLIKYADWLVEQTRPNKDMFRYTVQYITLQSERSKIMGHDAIFVHMVKQYYMSNEAWWINSELLDKMTKRALMLDKLLIGKKAPEMLLTDTLGKYMALNQLKAEYIILYFWDTDCGHCRTETPKVLELQHEMKQYGVETFAVCITRDQDKWLKYIRENKLDWINVNDGKSWTSFKDLYDIYSTPVLYLLDKDRVIIAKRVSIEQLERILRMKLGLEEGLEP